MGRLILHIGTHKTGTTSVQRFAASNRGVLAERGCFYPDYDLIGLKGHYAHIAIARAVSGSHGDGTFDLDAARRFFQAVAEKLPNYNVALVSAEPFYRIVSKGPKINKHNYWSRRSEIIGLTRELIGPVDTEVLVILRAQADFAASMYQEHVKVTRYGHGFADFRKEFWYLFDYHKQIQAWEKSFGKVKVGSYAHLSAGGELERSFFNFIGVDTRNIPQGRSHNTSIHPDIVLLKAALNRTELPDSDLASFVDCFRNWRGSAERILRPRSLWASDQERHLFQLRFIDGNCEIEHEIEQESKTAHGPMFSLPVLPENTVFGEGLDRTSISSILCTLALKKREKRHTPSGLLLSTLADVFSQTGHTNAAEELHRLAAD